MSSNIDLSKFIGSSKNLLDDLYNEERTKPEVLGYEEYLALPKTEAYIKREQQKKKDQQAYEDRIEEKYNHIINKISNE
jgi:hypothetical protein